MANLSRFEIYGPSSTLKRIGEAMLNDTPHVHYFTRKITDNQNVKVFIYEDLNTAVYCSRCVTCILSEHSFKVNLEIADVGKQSGFRGSQEPDEQPVYEQILDFILNFSKQYGLTVQNASPELQDKTEE